MNLSVTASDDKLSGYVRDMVKNAIKVYARLKPEKSRKRVVKYQIHRRPEEHSNQDFLVFTVRQRVDEYIDSRPEFGNFSFHKIFEESAKQADIFEDVARPVADSVLNGYNGTIFAYGQTGSGKTYTITGEKKCKDNCGIIPRTLQYIFEVIRKHPENVYSVEVAYLEIYNENGYDLLDRKQQSLFAVTRLEDLPRVTIQEDETGKLHLKNLTFYGVANENDAFELLTIGDANRMTAETPMNPHSSRSHCIFTLAISIKQFGMERYKRGKLHLVDLAGSERVYKCAITGTILTEAKHINLSLHYLEQVIVSLGQENAGHIPYRNSLLTAILRDSLGGNSLTTMLATLSVSTFNLEETMSTCRFAQRVALIKNDVNLILERDTQCENTLLKLENERLRQQITALTKQDAPFIIPCESVPGKGIEYYKDLVLQRDQEISLLIDMLKKEKEKVRVENESAEKSGAMKKQISTENSEHSKSTRSEQNSYLGNGKAVFMANNKIQQLNDTTIHKHAYLNNIKLSSIKTHNLTIHKLPNVDFQSAKNLELRNKAVQTKRPVSNSKKENYYDTGHQGMNFTVNGPGELLSEDKLNVKSSNGIQESICGAIVNNNYSSQCKAISTADFVKEHCAMYAQHNEDPRSYQQFLQSGKVMHVGNLSNTKKLLQIVHEKSSEHDKRCSNHEQLKPTHDDAREQYADKGRKSSELSIGEKCDRMDVESSSLFIDNTGDISKKNTRMYLKHISDSQGKEYRASTPNIIRQMESALTSQKSLNNMDCSTIVNHGFKSVGEFQHKKKNGMCTDSNTDLILNGSKKGFGNSFDLLHNQNGRKSLSNEIYKTYNKSNDSMKEEQRSLQAKCTEHGKMGHQLVAESSSVEKLKKVNYKDLILPKEHSNHLTKEVGNSSRRSRFDNIEACSNLQSTTHNVDISVHRNAELPIKEIFTIQGKRTNDPNKPQLYFPLQSVNKEEINYTFISPQPQYSNESLSTCGNQLPIINKTYLDHGTPREFSKESKNTFNAQSDIKIRENDENGEKSLPLTGDPEIDEEIIAFYKAKRTGSEY